MTVGAAGSKKPRAESSDAASSMGSLGVRIPLRKLVIVPLSEERSVPHPPLDEFFTTEWNTSISPMVRAILNHDFAHVQNKREFFYRKIESLVNCGFAQTLSSLLREEIQTHCHSVFMRSPRSRPHDTAKSILNEFENFSHSIDLIVRIFNPLDRLLIWENASMDITTIAFSVWKQLMCDMVLVGIVTTEIVDIAEKFFRCQSPLIMDESAAEFFKKLVSMNVQINTFESYVLPSFIQATRQWYIRTGEEMAAQCSVDSYAQTCHSIFSREESMMTSSGFPSSTWRQVDHEILRPELVMKNFPTLIERDLARVITESGDNYDCLALIYELSNKYPEKILTESVLKFTFGEAVKSAAKSAITDPNLNEREIIPNLIRICEKFVKIVETSFAGKQSFFIVFRDSMESIINHVINHIPMLLADYIDEQMWETVYEKIVDNPPIDPSNSWLPSALSLFKLVASKDLFEVHYRNFLAKRLLYVGSHFTTHSNALNYESAIIALLRAECGTGYTNKMESMLKDVLASEAFHEQHVYDKQSSNQMAWKCTVITTGVWPASIAPSDIVSVGEYEKNFVDTYKKNFPKKSIKFVCSLSSCLVRFNRRHELVCSGPQGIILNLFNDGSDSMSLDVIVQETRLSRLDIEKALKPMIDVGLVSLLNGVLELNISWQPQTNSSARHTVLNTYQYRREMDAAGPTLMSDTERLQTESSVAEDRQHQLDALIVRIMKKNKSMMLGDLLREISDTLPAALATFYSQTELKKRIDSLVDREFLEKISTMAQPENVEIRYLI